MQKQTFQNFMLVIISTGLTLFAVELGFRVYAYIQDQQTLANLEQKVSALNNGEKVKFGQMIKFSKNPKIIYELLPNLSVTFKNQAVNTNASGFRGEMYPTEKSETTRRVIGIGDSQMFGWGVKDEESYLSVLSDSLNHNSRCSWEVINTGVPGYNTVMEVETLRERGLPYQPDYVVVGYIGNDFALPNFIREEQNYFSFRKIFTIDYFMNNIKPINLKKTPLDQERKTFESQPSKVPPEYKDMVGKKAVINALEDLKEMSDAHDFSVILFMDNWERKHNKEEKLIIRTCNHLGFKVLFGYDLWTDYTEKHNIADPKNARFLSKTDPHASVSSHKATGQALFHMIMEETLKREDLECLTD